MRNEWSLAEKLVVWSIVFMMASIVFGFLTGNRWFEYTVAAVIGFLVCVVFFVGDK